MKPEIDGFTREQRISMVAQIAAGLLASGHYTELTESGYPVYQTTFKSQKVCAVEDANEILDEIIASTDKFLKFMAEE